MSIPEMRRIIDAANFYLPRSIFTSMRLLCDRQAEDKLDQSYSERFCEVLIGAKQHYPDFRRAVDGPRASADEATVERYIRGPQWAGLRRHILEAGR